MQMLVVTIARLGVDLMGPRWTEEVDIGGET